MTKSFEGKVAMITGAASGIGEAAAILFAKNGARTVVADRDPDKAEAVAEAIPQMGGNAFFHQVAVADSAQVRGLTAAHVGRYRRLARPYKHARVCGPPAAIAHTAETDLTHPTTAPP